MPVAVGDGSGTVRPSVSLPGAASFATSGDLPQRIQSGGDRGLVAGAGADRGKNVAHRRGLSGERDAHDGVVAGQMGPPGHKGNAESAGDQGGAEVPFVGVVGNAGAGTAGVLPSSSRAAVSWPSPVRSSAGSAPKPMRK